MSVLQLANARTGSADVVPRMMRRAKGRTMVSGTRHDAGMSFVILR